MNSGPIAQAKAEGGQPGSWLLASLGKALGHDLANQLVAAQGLLRLLETEEGDRLGDEGREYLRRIRGAVERSHTLAGRLADLARAACSTEPWVAIALPDLMHEMTIEMKRLYTDRALAFQCDILVTGFQAPARSFRQVLAILFRHAIKGGEDGACRIAVQADPLPRGVQLRITRSGTSSPVEEQGHLFDPSVEVGAGTADRLELALARTYVERWGGELRCEAEQRGKTFILRLPLAEEPRAT